MNKSTLAITALLATLGTATAVSVAYADNITGAQTVLADCGGCSGSSCCGGCDGCSGCTGCAGE